MSVEVDRGGGKGKEWLIYVGCGSGAGGNMKDWWEYNVNEDTWTQREDLPGPARHHPYYFDAKVKTCLPTHSTHNTIRNTHGTHHDTHIITTHTHETHTTHNNPHLFDSPKFKFIFNILYDS